MLGRLTLNTSKSHSSLLNSLENSIKDDLNDLIASVAKELNIHDFYSAHILDYCEVSLLLPITTLIIVEAKAIYDRKRACANVPRRRDSTRQVR